jgi:hypothetical protein
MAKTPAEESTVAREERRGYPKSNLLPFDVIHPHDWYPKTCTGNFFVGKP